MIDRAGHLPVLFAAIPLALVAAVVAPIVAVAAPTTCALVLPGSDRATSAECLACHASQSQGGHPYDIAYTGTASRPGGLRSLDEAIQRGVFLPDREVRCVTCHDGKSPWKDHIRLPAGTKPTHAVDPRRRETYENATALAPPQPGDAVGTKPLCLECHALD